VTRFPISERYGLQIHLASPRSPPLSSRGSAEVRYLTPLGDYAAAGLASERSPSFYRACRVKVIQADGTLELRYAAVVRQAELEVRKGVLENAGVSLRECRKSQNKQEKN